MRSPHFYRKLRRIRVLVIFTDLVRHLCLWLMGSLLAVWGHFLGDYLLRWRMATRFTVIATVGIGILIALERVFLRRLFVRPSVRQIALRFEQRTPWRGLLISGVEFVEHPPASSDLAQVVFHKLDARLSELRFRQIGRWRDAGIPLSLLLIFILVTVAAVEQHPPIAQAWWARLHQTAAVYPASVRIVRTQPGHTQIVAGQRILLSTRAEGRLPETATLEYVYRDQTYRVPVLRSRNSYTYRLGPLVDSFRYQFLVADAETPVYQVEVLPPLEVAETEVRLHFPEYTGRPPERAGVGNVEVVEGTRIQVRAQANRPVASVVRLVQRDWEEAPQRIPVELPSPTATWTATWQAEQSETWWFEARDTYGFANPHPVRHRVLVRPDTPPRVWIERPGRHLEATRRAKLPLTAHAQDDFAVTAWALHTVIRRGGRQVFSGETPIAIARPGAAVSVKNWTLDLGALPLEVGDVLRYWVSARDNRVPHPQTGRSQEYEIRILSRLEAAAILGKQQKALRRDLEALIDAQERLLEVTRTLRR